MQLSKQYRYVAITGQYVNLEVTSLEDFISILRKTHDDIYVKYSGIEALQLCWDEDTIHFYFKSDLTKEELEEKEQQELANTEKEKKQLAYLLNKYKDKL